MTDLLPRNPARPAGICRACGEHIHWSYQAAAWYHDTISATFNCTAPAVAPLCCGHCNDTHEVHQRRRGPLCDNCFAVAPVMAEYQVGIKAEAQADGEHIRLQLDSFNPFGSSAYLDAEDARAVIELLEGQLKVIGSLQAAERNGNSHV